MQVRRTLGCCRNNLTCVTSTADPNGLEGPPADSHKESCPHRSDSSDTLLQLNQDWFYAPWLPHSFYAPWLPHSTPFLLGESSLIETNQMIVRSGFAMDGNCHV